MKNIYSIIIIFSLTACQTLGSIPERLGLTEEDPNAPVKLDLNYESNLELLWEKKAEKPLINFNFFEEKIESVKFFDLNASKLIELFQVFQQVIILFSTLMLMVFFMRMIQLQVN